MNIDLGSIDKELLTEAQEVLDYTGLDVLTAVKMMLKKIINEKDISFLLAKMTVQPEKAISGNKLNTTKMTKSKAIYLFKSNGYDLNGNITFASKNKAANNYWANPDVLTLLSDWYLILNDWDKQKLHLFYIPKNTISKHEITVRSDKTNQIDLQIMYDDSSFTDTRSKISFKQYLLETIKY